MKLRGATVLARCHADGSLADERGRVEIRYKPNDGRAYSASARNLKPAGDALLLAPGDQRAELHVVAFGGAVDQAAHHGAHPQREVH